MTEVTLSGSCLCGEVAYEVTGTLGNFFLCHCSRCRKSTGSGHASNIFITGASFKFTAGEDTVRAYRKPDAKYFGNTFCSQCGSRLPRFSAERGVAVVPAGSLDVDPGILPDAHIFRSSAAAWTCSAGDMPAYDRYPPRT